MLGMQGGEEVKSIRTLNANEKRVLFLLKPDGYEYRFEGVWTGRDIKNVLKLLTRAYRMHKSKKAKLKASKEK